jgi:acyl-CoA thioester hydrolase
MRTAYAETAQGWPTSRYLEVGAGWVVRSHQIVYLSPGFLDDEIVVRTWVAGFKKISSLRRYRTLRISDNTLLAQAETNWVFIGFAQGVPRRIPDDVASSFEVVPE